MSAVLVRPAVAGGLSLSALRTRGSVGYQAESVPVSTRKITSEAILAECDKKPDFTETLFHDRGECRRDWLWNPSWM